jgi:predicted NAD/FAD-binding protein
MLYVNAVVSRLDAASAETPVCSVRRVADGMIVHAEGAAPRSFDAVVIAVHADQALLMLDSHTPAEHAVPGAISLLDESRPAAHRRIVAAAASPDTGVVEPPITGNRDEAVVTYDVSRLMRLPGSRRFLLSLTEATASTRGRCWPR